eukprot:scpid28183/ scgid5278/ 
MRYHQSSVFSFCIFTLTLCYVFAHAVSPRPGTVVLVQLFARISVLQVKDTVLHLIIVTVSVNIVDCRVRTVSMEHCTTLPLVGIRPVPPDNLPWPRDGQTQPTCAL